MFDLNINAVENKQTTLVSYSGLHIIMHKTNENLGINIAALS